MPRFSIKDLMLAITLVAISLGGMHYADAGLFEPPVWNWAVCGAVVGAGTMHPFGLRRVGAILGFVAVFIVWGILLSMPGPVGFYL
jgi:hypothetical protein